MINGFAGYGVHLFFVLSGFLITGILLGERNNVEQLGITRSRAFRQFYVRRALRIFPLYYFIVLSGIALNVNYARDYAPWLLSYTINLKMAAQGWYIDHFAHFWSLAIEEQYYLVWPCLILLLPRKWLVPAAGVAIATGPLFRLYVALSSHLHFATAWITGYIATPTALDSLGMGSLVAILMASDASARRLRGWMRLVVPLAGTALVAVFQFGPHGMMHFVFLDTAAAILFAWLIYTAARGFGGITGRILTAAPLIFLGRISYGIYVYHPLVPDAAAKVAPRLGLSMPTGVWMNALLDGALTIAVAAMSWYALERPINRLKRKFPYVGVTG